MDVIFTLKPKLQGMITSCKTESLNRVWSRLLFGFLLIFLWPIQTLADNHPVGSRAAAMANAAVTHRDVWSTFHNQAGIAYIEHITAGFHHENRFLVKEYGLQSFAFLFPVNAGTFGATYTYFGYSLYNESKAGISFGKKLGQKFAAGVQLNYFNTFVADGYGNTGTVTFEGGILATPVENLWLGAHIFNPTRATYDDFPDDPLPAIIRLGAGYTFYKKVILTVEAEKSLDYKARFKSGLEAELLDDFYVRAGISTEPVYATFGIGYSRWNVTLDLAFTNHPALGFTPHFSLQYAFR